MYMLSTKTRSVLLTVLSLFLCCSLFPLQVQAEQLQRTITITEQQEWGQIIVESNINEFEVDIITPEGTRWTHSEETDVDVLFYYSFENMRHWSAETLKAGTYQVIIDGPANATYTIRNQDSYNQLELSLITPTNQTIVVKEQSYNLEVTWSYTGDIMRSNTIDFYLAPISGGKNIELGSSLVSLNRTSLTIPNDLIDGSYQLYAIYDNNTSESVNLDPLVTLQIERGFAGEQVEIVDIVAAGAELYAEFNVPHTRIQGVEVSLVDSNKPDQYTWTSYELSELTKLVAPDKDDTEQLDTNYDYRYSLFIPVAQNGSYKLAVRPISSNSLPGPIAVSEQEIKIQANEWPTDLVSWSLPDGVSNANHAELTISYKEPVQVQLLVDGQLVFEQEVDSAAEPWVMDIPLSEGEHSYELVIFDSYGNYFTDGRIWTIDHTAPRLEMIGPLDSHSRIPNHLVSGWTETNVSLRINNDQVEVDQHGYFSYETKASSIDIVAADESGNETVYHWSTVKNSSELTLTQWILIVCGIIIFVGVALYLLWRHNKSSK